MKKIALFAMILTTSILLVACGEKTKVQDTKDSTPINSIDNSGDSQDIGYTSYKKPDFTEKAGFEVYKDESLSNVNYDGIRLVDEAKGELDLTFDDGRKAVLSVTANEYFFDENEASTFSVADVELSKIEGIDGFNHYYWKKDDIYYTFSSSSSADFTNEEFEKIIKGFSVKAGENN